LRLNFRGAPLDLVLDYLSKAAGYTIVLGTEMKGTVDVWSDQPLSKEAAIAVLNTSLNRNGYAVVRNGQRLTIVPRDEVRKYNIRVQSGANPEAIEPGEEMITHIIPVKYANVTQMVKDLTPLLPASATLTANESASALVLTDTMTDVRRMVEIVKALDMSITPALTVKVFPLKNADPQEMVQILTRLFPDESTKPRSAAETPPWFRFSRRFGSEGGVPLAVGGGGTSGELKAGKVIAVADQRTSSVIVTAANELMPQIKEMIDQLDTSPAKKQQVKVFQLKNAEVNDVMPVLRDLFNKDTTAQRSSSSLTSQSSALSTRRTRTAQNVGTSATTGTRGSGLGGSPSGF
jgi:general secretion pathway protein D